MYKTSSFTKRHNLLKVVLPFVGVVEKLSLTPPAYPTHPGRVNGAEPGAHSNMNRSGGGGCRLRPPPRVGHPSSSSFFLLLPPPRLRLLFPASPGQPPARSHRVPEAAAVNPRPAAGRCPLRGRGNRAPWGRLARPASLAARQ